MSFKNTNNLNDGNQSQKIAFTITEKIEKLGIKWFFLHDKDFLITWSNGRCSCMEFKSSSISQNIILIEKTLKKEVKGIVDDETFDNAIKDIEDQLIKRRAEMFNLNKTKTLEKNYVDDEFLKDVSGLREQFEKSSDPYKEWQQEVKKRHHTLHKITIKHYPEAWSIMEFCLAVKSIQNIHGNATPFIGIILAKPSSLKTTIIELFRKYDKTFYSDNFTPNSMISHNSSLSEEQLQNIDMLPKMHNKFVLTPELAPIFTDKDDDLQKVLGIITRIVDGKGYESDSGAQGHRKYSDIMFSWVGAAVEIPPKVWKLLSQLGFKLYFLRPNIKEKSVNDLVTIIKDNDYILKNKEIEEALLDYLKVFDAAPINTDLATVDENSIVKVKWNFDSTRNDTIDKEQIKVLEYISQLAKLLAHLRGTVYSSQSKMRKYQKLQDSSTVNNNNNEGIEEISFQTEELDYEIDSDTIEDPPRAGIVLRNLALANAIVQGRDYLTKEDVRLIIRVAFSTTRIHRSKLLDLLLKNGGELTTSQIVNELGMSEPSARKTMREFEALRIANISSTSGYANSELTLVLDNKFNWFLSKEFQNLKDERESTTTTPCQSNLEYRRMYLPTIVKTLSNSYYTIQKACDSNCHTLKENLPPETDIKNNNKRETITESTTTITCQTFENEINTNPKTDNSNSKNIKNYIIDDNNPDSFKDQENSASLGPEIFQHVTASNNNYHKESKSNHNDKIPEDVIEDILKVIKDEGGPIALGYALQLACQGSEIVKEYFKGEKLTARESRKARNLFVQINRHPNIAIVKKKPQFVVKWIEKEEAIINN